ncbi:MAG: hypothetical protein JSU81_09565 [Candidatus Coatesbacteria bacterium]|nr:MAG: hypothetical protein JSU81_09565 [Candidatus Coatesbacteria bacterium]
MRRAVIISVMCALASSAGAAEEASLEEAAKYLEAGETEKAAAELLAYGRGDPTAPLANQALDGVFLLYKKKIPPEVLAPYVEALAVLADGYAGAAEAAWREMAEEEELPWPVRGRAALLVAELNVSGDRLAVLERAWRECDDDTARLLGIALAEAYVEAGQLEEARAVRGEFAERFPGDEGLGYFDYLDEEEK